MNLIDRLAAPFSLLPLDKSHHFISGSILFALLHPFILPLCALAAVAAVAVAKEIWDHFNPPHCAEVYDALATIAGGLICYSVTWNFL